MYKKAELTVSWVLQRRIMFAGEENILFSHKSKAICHGSFLQSQILRKEHILYSPSLRFLSVRNLKYNKISLRSFSQFVSVSLQVRTKTHLCRAVQAGRFILKVNKKKERKKLEESGGVDRNLNLQIFLKRFIIHFVHFHHIWKIFKKLTWEPIKHFGYNEYEELKGLLQRIWRGLSHSTQWKQWQEHIIHTGVYSKNQPVMYNDTGVRSETGLVSTSKSLSMFIANALFKL